jgi:hypothetical protein
MSYSSMLYNAAKQDLSLTAIMEWLKNRRVGERRWHNVLIGVAIFSLTFSLATRFCIQTASRPRTANSVERRSLEPGRQHLDKDPSGWVPPSRDFCVIEPPAAASEADLPSAELILTTHVFSVSLYKRPPPLSRFLS